MKEALITLTDLYFLNRQLKEKQKNISESRERERKYTYRLKVMTK